MKFDDRFVEADAGDTLLEAARASGINIPTLCYHPALEPYGACRLCSVEIEKNGKKRIVTACNYPSEEGLIVKTCSPEVVRIRKMIVELLVARCPEERIIQKLAKEYGIDEPRFRPEDENCILCGLCTRVCEELVGVSAINVVNRGVARGVDAPYGDLSQDCIGCGSCAMVCPTDAIKGMRNIFPISPEEAREIEDEFLSGTRDGELGVYSDLLSGKTFLQGQDGGIVTSLLVTAMENGLIDAAIVVPKCMSKGSRAEAAVADRVEDIIAAKGTKYMRVSVISRLVDALRQEKRKVAIVGTPCQIRAVRKLQIRGCSNDGVLNDLLQSAELTLLGLFCFESFDHRDLRNRIVEIMGVDLDDADRIQISRGNYIVVIGKEEYVCKVKELESTVCEGCQFCNDFVSRLADISIGSVGSPDGYSTILVRSDRGKKLIEASDFVRAEASKDDILKLSRLKQKRAERSFAKITDGLAARGGYPLNLST